VLILQEYAELAGWTGPPWPSSTPDPVSGPYAVVLRPQEVRTIERASAAVQEAAREVLAQFLPAHPTAFDGLARGRLKKLPEHQLWQLHLPDGYRLRYLVDGASRAVHVVSLAPHRDGDLRGREQESWASIRRVRHRSSG